MTKTPFKKLQEVDNRDDRREIWHLLHRLQPFERIGFLSAECEIVPHGTRSPDGQFILRPVPLFHKMRPLALAAHNGGAPDEMLTNEVYGDLLLLTLQYGTVPSEMAVRLESRIRRGITYAV